MKQSVVGRWRVAGGMQVLLGLCLILGVFSLSVLGLAWVIAGAYSYVW